jgi:uncharacterized protein YutD
MFKNLGSKKVTFIVLLLLVTVGIGAGYYYWLMPLREQVTQELNSTRSAVEQKYQEVARMKEEYVLLQNQLRDFGDLKLRGFFNDQDRSRGIESLGKLSDYAQLLKAKLKFGSGQLVADPLADQASQVVLKSPVTVNVSAMDDVDVYSFLKFVQEKFPGDIDVTSMKLKRTEIFNEAMLRKIGGGSASPLIESEIVFDWYTMAPKDVVAPTEGGN